MNLPQIAEMLCLDGERMSGASMASERAIEQKLKLTSKAYCVVLAWIVLYVHHVLSHSGAQLSKGESVITRYANYVDPAGIFETVETIYILRLRGFRKSADIETFRAAQA